METTKIATLTSTKITAISTRIAIGFGLLTVGFIAPLIGNQLITGTIVNATLISAAVLLGLPEAILLAFGPSVISLAIGKLPLALAPMLPSIMIGNILLIVIFKLISNRSSFLAAIVASVAKFALIFATATMLVYFINSGPIIKIASMMGWIQLATALLGSALALSILTVTKQLKK